MTAYRKEIFIPFHLCDPAGIFFFGHAFQLAHQVYEQFIIEKLNIAWKEWFQNEEWIIPIKQAKAEYKAPLFAGQSVVVELKVANLGTSSFVVQSRFIDGEVEHCLVETVHVFCSRSSRQKQPIPHPIYEKLTEAFVA